MCKLAFMPFFTSVLFICVLLQISGADQIHPRQRRHLVFPKGSKYFIRINIRENVFDYTNIFAKASGFIMKWDLPDKPHHRKLKKRDIEAGLRDLLKRFDFGSENCLSNLFCRDELSGNTLNTILNLLGLNGKKVVCENWKPCPLSLNNFIPVNNI